MECYATWDILSWYFASEPTKRTAETVAMLHKGIQQFIYGERLSHGASDSPLSEVLLFYFNVGTTMS